jgi:hypothetical protein
LAKRKFARRCLDNDSSQCLESLRGRKGTGSRRIN